MTKPRNYTSTNVNPCKMCMPMGASLAFKGIEGGMALIHGSQGCSTYIRRHISTHYDEPVDIASSSLNEKDTIHGGAKNLKHGLKNVISLYSPKVIGVLTTCLTETIGEDVAQITAEFKERHQPEGVDIIPVRSPGYGGSHYEGYFAALLEIVKYYAHPCESHSGINIVTGFMTPSEVRELKRIVSLFGAEAVVLPDISETMNEPYTGKYAMIPAGGTRREDIARMAGARATVEFGACLPESLSPGAWLEQNRGVPLYRLPLPISLKNTDNLLAVLAVVTGHSVPQELKADRGRLLDAMIDSHKHNSRGRAAIFGDPETVLAVTALCLENGIVPAVAVTGTKADLMTRAIRSRRGFNAGETLTLADTDFETIQRLVRERDVNILIGNSDGKFVEEKEHVPLVRIGFPVHDHVGACRRVNIGYRGTALFLDDITNQLIDLEHGAFRRELYETYWTGESIQEERI